MQSFHLQFSPNSQYSNSRLTASSKEIPFEHLLYQLPLVGGASGQNMSSLGCSSRIPRSPHALLRLGQTWNFPFTYTSALTHSFFYHSLSFPFFRFYQLSTPDHSLVSIPFIMLKLRKPFICCLLLFIYLLVIGHIGTELDYQIKSYLFDFFF